VLAGMRTSARSGAAHYDTGVTGSSFAKSSGKVSVIMNIMRGMGYEEGRGLGAQKQGIIEPVTAKLRPGRGAVGAYGREQQGPKFGGLWEIPDSGSGLIS
jgi:G-patch domain